MTEYLVELTFADLQPDAVPEALRAAEACRAAELAEQGTLRRLWRVNSATRGLANVGIWRATDESTLQDLIAALPFADHLTETRIRALEPHPNDPQGQAR